MEDNYCVDNEFEVYITKDFFILIGVLTNTHIAIIIIRLFGPIKTSLKAVGYTISMQVEPWFSHKVERDVGKWERGGEHVLS